ncbi:MAG: hypothetical protein ACRD4Y_07845 [Candidatus Acidiferrales bacterium]
MQLISGKVAAEHISGILHPQYQVHGFAVHLTVRTIFSLDPTGQIDFGGGEYIPAGRRELSSHPVRPEDKYKWWDLGRGSYFAVCNETLHLAANEIALIEPEDRLLRAGGWHVPLFVRGHVDPVELLLEVGVARLRVKENARLARVRLFRIEEAKTAARASGKRAAPKSKSAKDKK